VGQDLEHGASPDHGDGYADVGSGDGSRGRPHAGPRSTVDHDAEAPSKDQTSARARDHAACKRLCKPC
jgi:hypothetical protein